MRRLCIAVCAMLIVGPLYVIVISLYGLLKLGTVA
jgi:hypothetical protein